MPSKNIIFLTITIIKTIFFFFLNDVWRTLGAATRHVPNVFADSVGGRGQRDDEYRKTDGEESRKKKIKNFSPTGDGD